MAVHVRHYFRRFDSYWSTAVTASTEWMQGTRLLYHHAEHKQLSMF